MLPIGVIIPTRNSAGLLPDHLSAMESWLPEVEEVVAVDSESTDGTQDLLRSRLRHPRLRLLQHPRGLYQSWNYGIRQLSAAQCYISTVGETITRDGLRKLSGILEEKQCDVVISKPRFVNLQGQPVAAPEWPIDDVVSSLRLAAPVVLEGVALFLFTLTNFRDAILGSSASNLYRTRCLQERPFPTDYGTAGDGGWGLIHCCGIRLGIAPGVFSTFREHPKAYSKAEYAVDALTHKMLERISLTFEEEKQRSPAFTRQTVELRFEEIIALLRQQAEYQRRLELCRAGFWPWSLNPVAWRARLKRGALARKINRLKASALRKLFPAP